jgi:hypothetical protein
MAPKIAFLILGHTDAHQLARLCAALGPYDDIFIHVDRKTPDCFFAVPLPSNAQLIQPRIFVQWADVSVVHATLLLIENALSSSGDYLRLVLLSGTCYPIKPIEQLREHFIRQPNRNEIKYVNLLEGPTKALRRISRWHFRRPLICKTQNELLSVANKAVRKVAYLAVRSLDRGFQQYFPDLTPYFGSQWWALTPAAANYALHFSRKTPELLAYMRHCWAPDEIFFHTVLGNSEYAAGPEPYTQDLSRVANLHIVQPAASKIFRYCDLPEVMASDKFFVRKLETGASDKLADAIDRKILNPRDYFEYNFNS